VAHDDHGRLLAHRFASTSSAVSAKAALATPSAGASAPSTSAPSAVPTPSPTRRWWKVEPFDCGAHPNPLQLVKKPGVGLFLQERASGDGVFRDVYQASGFTAANAVGAAALYRDDETGEHYAFAIRNRKLCAFDDSDVDCHDTKIKSNNQANVGAIIGSTYYYTRGDFRDDKNADAVHAVWDIDKFQPSFATTDDVRVRIKRNLFGYFVHDVAAVVEHGSEVIEDDDANGMYLVGLGRQRWDRTQPRLVVFKIDPVSKLVDKYAVLQSSIDWTGKEVMPGGSSRSHFGAAFSYDDDDNSYGSTGHRVFFASSSSWGLLELELDTVFVPESCWNTGLDKSGHAACDSEAWLRYAGESTVPDVDLTAMWGHDGLNCIDATPNL